MVERQLQLPVTMASLSFSLSLSLHCDNLWEGFWWLVWIIHLPQWVGLVQPGLPYRLSMDLSPPGDELKWWGGDARHLEARATKSIYTTTMHSGSSWISHHHCKMQTWKTDLKWADEFPTRHTHICVPGAYDCYLALNKKCTDMIKDPARRLPWITLLGHLGWG